MISKLLRFLIVAALVFCPPALAQIGPIPGMGPVLISSTRPFPVVQSVNGGTKTSSTSQVLNLPTGIVSGDLLVVIYSHVNSTTVSSSGWTFLSEDTASNLNLGFAYKTATGSEGSTVTFTLGTSRSLAYISYRISGWSGTPEKGTAATNTSTSPNPPSLAPSWGASNTLWLAAAGNGTGVGQATTGFPTNYSNGQSQNATAAVGSAQRSLNAASEDPGTFTIASSVIWLAQTYAISP